MPVPTGPVVPSVEPMPEEPDARIFVTGPAGDIAVVDIGQARETKGSARHAKSASTLGRGRISTNAKVTAFIALVALCIRLYQLAQPGHLLGVTEYDDGVYFGAALQLVHGFLPYRSFVLVEPPGLPVLLSPFALLSHWFGSRNAFAAARIVTAVVDSANVVVLGAILRRRKTIVVIVATAFLACNASSIATALSVAQEPYLDLFCLLGMLAVFDGDRLTSSLKRWIIAGLFFGLAGSVKTWALFPFVALVLVGVPFFRRRVLPAIASAIVGFAVVCGTFIVKAPHAFERDVIAVQFGRVDVARSPLIGRIATMTGAWLTAYPLLVYGVAIAMVMILVLAYMIHLSRRPSPLETFSLLSVGIIVIVLLIPYDFFVNYSALLGPFLALALGLAIGRIVDYPNVPERVIGVLLAIGLIIHGANFVDTWDTRPPFDPSATISADVPPGACVISDSVTVLILADRFNTSDASCPDIVDSYGLDLVLARGYTFAAGGSASPVVQQNWLSYFEHSDYLVFTGRADGTIPATAAILSVLHHDFVSISPTVGASYPPYSGIYARTRRSP